MSERDNAILEWQRALRNAERVFCVHIRCGGETSLHGIYQTQAAAESERDWYNANNESGWLGKASISAHPLVTEEMLRRHPHE
jgi:hypothetical protein